MKYYTMKDVRNRIPLFFERGTMRFFDSRIVEKLYQGRGGRFFVTSERFSPDSPRLYTVRRFRASGRKSGRIDTVGGFQDYKTLREAKRAAERLARGK